jgi:carboxyl-terminal processing protease
MSSPPRRRARALRALSLAAAAALVFTLGVLAGATAHTAAADGGSRYRALDLFAQVFAHVENLYVDDVPREELAHGAIEGLVGKLDPHSAFLPPDLYRAMKDETSGEFEGVGLELGLRDARLTVIAPLEGSPGARAGIEAGDRLLAIDGVPTEGMPLADAVRRLKGPAGSPVRLELVRGLAPLGERTVVRDRVVSHSVEWRVADARRGLVVLRIRTFQERTDRAVERGLAAARKELGREIGGLVLDLRSNPGGLLDEAVRVADRFISEGLIVTTEGRRDRVMDVERARRAGTEPDYPLAVLVDGGSASASEILAGALQDHGRAAVVGSRTFGKGTVQQVLDLGDGSGLKLTVARYFTPLHRSIQDRGIVPDLEVADAPIPVDGSAAAVVNASAVASSSGVIATVASDPAPRDVAGGDPALEAALAHVASRAQSRLH